MSKRDNLGYVGKDIIHEGCGLPLTPDRVWEKVPHSVRKGINKAERNGVIIKKVKGTPEDIEVLKGMWYDPEDPNMPTHLTEKEFMFIAYYDENPIGSVILLPVGNHLFLNNLAGSRDGKKLHIQDYLLWHCVNYFENSEYKYIDVGVSYRPSLYKFFTKWKIESYPIIFNAPDVKVPISDIPFAADLYHRDYDFTNWEDGYKVLADLTGVKELTFVPGEEYAKNICGEEGQDFTDVFPNIPKEKLGWVNLEKIFNVQFGTIVIGKAIDDAEMWNSYGCLDVFKRRFILTVIQEEIKKLDAIKKIREENHQILEDYFGFEDIKPEKLYNEGKEIKSYYYFKHERNDRYHLVLDNFEIKHVYFENEGVIGLPIHQNLTKWQLEYIYGTFRGVLNLCSEWTHTDVYGDYKN